MYDRCIDMLIRLEIVNSHTCHFTAVCAKSKIRAIFLHSVYFCLKLLSFNVIVKDYLSYMLCLFYYLKNKC